MHILDKFHKIICFHIPSLDVVAEPWIDELIFPALRTYLGLSADYTVEPGHCGLSEPVVNNPGEPICNGDSEHIVNGRSESSSITNDLSESTSRLVESNTRDQASITSGLAGSLRVSNMNGDNKTPSAKDMDERTKSVETENSKLITTDVNVEKQNDTQKKISGKIHATESQLAADTETSQNVVSLVTEESVAHSLPPLAESSLNLPVCPPRFIDLAYDVDANFVSMIVNNIWPNLFFHHVPINGLIKSFVILLF
jgi:hypothetical protein